MPKPLFFLLAATLMLSGCTPVVDPRDSGAATQLETIRHMAITYGAQSGLAGKAQLINQTLDAHADELDRIYNFNALMMKNNMMPPVIEEAKQLMHADAQDSMRMADREIHIVRPAQLVTTPPTWRDYLRMTYQKPERPDASLHPRNEKERLLWKQGFEQGWVQGVKQADDIFAQSLGMINRDFNGMVLYHVFLAQNMITPAYTAQARLGITGDEKRMRINDRMLRITENAKLTPARAEDWQAVMALDDE